MGDKPLFTPDEQKRRDKSNPVQSTSKGVEKQEVKKKTKSSTADRSRDPPKSQNLDDMMTRALKGPRKGPERAWKGPGKGRRGPERPQKGPE